MNTQKSPITKEFFGYLTIFSFLMYSLGLSALFAFTRTDGLSINLDYFEPVWLPCMVLFLFSIVVWGFIADRYSSDDRQVIQAMSSFSTVLLASIFFGLFMTFALVQKEEKAGTAFQLSLAFVSIFLIFPYCAGRSLSMIVKFIINILDRLPRR